jgi:molybdopterin-guanine dinucleotide biosynthesis protein A
MGQDKALMPFLGIPLIERLRDRFLVLNREILIISNEFTGYEYLGLSLHKDVIPDRGALGGLLTALTITDSIYVALIAADLPFSSPKLLGYLFDMIQNSDYDAVIPSSKYGLEPMHSIYRRETCLPLVRDAIKKDQWRMRSWHEQAHNKILDPKEVTRITGTEYTFLNLNTPEEFSSAEELAIQFDLFKHPPDFHEE